MNHWSACLATEPDKIVNTRLFRLKQRTLPWQFNVVYMPGKSNSAADAASRYPSGPACETLSEPDIMECAITASIRKDTSDITAITWDEICKETRADATQKKLGTHVRNSSLEDSNLDDDLKPFLKYRHGLFVTGDDVIMYNDRVVMPQSLRPSALHALHSAHQGTTGMGDRALTIMFWPGITSDINKSRNECAECCKHAPSQSSPPPYETCEVPAVPFDSIFADYFSEKGYYYLVAGDRLSGWVEVFATPHNSSKSGARGLMSMLRVLFRTFGVPSVMSSDGGPEFKAYETQEFLRRWDVHHRRSSACYPQSNGRAEVAVKKSKRLLLSCIGPSGSLDND